MARGNPLHVEDTLLDVDESNEVLTEIQPSIDIVVTDSIVNVTRPENSKTLETGEETRTGKSSKNSIRDLLLDNTFGSIDFTGAQLSADRTKECVNKTTFVETLVSDR